MTIVCTCSHFAGVLVIRAAGSVSEAAMCVSNTLNVLVGVRVDPLAVGRWIAVQPVGGPSRRRRHLVQPKPVVVIRSSVQTDNQSINQNTFI